MSSFNTLRTKMYLYQFGVGTADYFIFPKTDFDTSLAKPVKQQYEDSNFIDGAIRTNLGERNNLGAVEIPITFQVSDEDYFTLDYVKKVFNLPPQKAFLWQQNASGDIKMFFNPVVDIVKTVEQQYKANSSKGQEIENLNATFKSTLPFLYECKGNISYFDYDNYVITQLLYQASNPVTYNGSRLYGEGAIVSTIALSTLTIDQKISFFNSCNSTKALVYRDKFFDKTGIGIEAGQEVISRLLNSNSVTDVVTSDIYKNTTAENRTYLVEISGILNANETLTINNLNNNSGLKITWLSPSPSPSVVYYNSFWEQLLTSTGVVIDPLNYRLEQPEPNFLYFSALSSQNRTLTQNTETIRLQKNSVNNLTIKIENLNTYII